MILLANLDENDRTVVEQCYTKDTNTIPSSYHLNIATSSEISTENTNVNISSTKRTSESTSDTEQRSLKSLLEVFGKLFQKENLERKLYELFLPGELFDSVLYLFLGKNSVSD